MARACARGVIDDSIARERIPNAHNVRALPAMLADCGFVVTGIEVHPFVVENYSTAKYLIRFDTVVDQLLRRGEITTTQYGEWQRYEEASGAMFRLIIPQFIVMAIKP
jgi:hypothetical protein